MAHYVSADLRYGGRGYPLGGLRGADEFSFNEVPEFDSAIDPYADQPRMAPPARRVRARRKCKPGRVKSCKIQVSTLRNGKRVRRRVCRDARGLIVSNRPAGSRKRSGGKKRKRGK